MVGCLFWLKIKLTFWLWLWFWPWKCLIIPLPLGWLCANSYLLINSKCRDTALVTLLLKPMGRTYGRETSLEQKMPFSKL